MQNYTDLGSFIALYVKFFHFFLIKHPYLQHLGMPIEDGNPQARYAASNRHGLELQRWRLRPDGPIQSVVNLGAHVELHQQRVVGIGVYTVGQQHVG